MFTTSGSSQALEPVEAGVWRVGLLEGKNAVDSMLLLATILSISFLEMPVTLACMNDGILYSTDQNEKTHLIRPSEDPII